MGPTSWSPPSTPPAPHEETHASSSTGARGNGARGWLGSSKGCWGPSCPSPQLCRPGAPLVLLTPGYWALRLEAGNRRPKTVFVASWLSVIIKAVGPNTCVSTDIQAHTQANTHTGHACRDNSSSKIQSSVGGPFKSYGYGKA